MRKAFIEKLTQLAEKDSRLYLIIADIGFDMTKPFSDKFPNRFINVGVAEQNMIGVATGLALSGKIPFCYSISNFPTLRCLEQIRNGVCHHDLNVNIVAGGTGLAYGALGETHHAVGDIAIMRVLPNMNIIAPSSTEMTSRVVEVVYSNPHPSYLRLGVTAMIHQDDTDFNIGMAYMRSGEDIAIVSTGSMLSLAIDIENKLEEYCIKPIIVDMPTIKPIDIEMIKLIAKSVKLIVTIEEHSIIGGLGSAVSEVLSEMPNHAKLIRFGVRDSQSVFTGDRDYLLRKNGLDAQSIIERILNETTTI